MLHACQPVCCSCSPTLLLASVAQAEADKTLLDSLLNKSIVDKFHAVEGFAALPGALIGLLRGQNTGKMMVKIPEMTNPDLKY